MTLKERYLRWRLTPAEWLLYQMLKAPAEWTHDTRRLHHPRSETLLYVGDPDSTCSVFDITIRHSGLPTLTPGKFAKRLLHKMALDIRYPPPPTPRVLQQKYFEHLMKAELGEK